MRVKGYRQRVSANELGVRLNPSQLFPDLCGKVPAHLTKNSNIGGFGADAENQDGGLLPFSSTVINRVRSAYGPGHAATAPHLRIRAASPNR
jgi:hypothetical protein